MLFLEKIHKFSLYDLYDHDVALEAPPLHSKRYMLQGETNFVFFNIVFTAQGHNSDT